MYEEYIGKQLNEFIINSIDIIMSDEYNTFYELAIQIYNSKTNKLIYEQTIVYNNGNKLFLCIFDKWDFYKKLDVTIIEGGLFATTNEFLIHQFNIKNYIEIKI